MAAYGGQSAPSGELDADDLLDLAGADVGLRVEAELLLTAEAGDVLVEAAARFRRDIDPVLLPREDLDIAAVDEQPGARLGRRPVRVGPQGNAPRRGDRRGGGRAAGRVDGPAPRKRRAQGPRGRFP